MSEEIKGRILSSLRIYKVNHRAAPECIYLGTQELFELKRTCYNSLDFAVRKNDTTETPSLVFDGIKVVHVKLDSHIGFGVEV